MAHAAGAKSHSKSLFTRAQGLLGLLLLGGIPEDQDDSEERSAGFLNRSRAVINRRLPAVLGDEHRVVCQADHGTQAENLIHRVIYGLAGLLVNDVEDGR